jgi:cysteine desulfurase family protein (TIGR01976 family)
MTAPRLPDRAQVRARFPALSGSTVYFENAGGSQLPAEVPAAVARYMTESYVQLGAGYPASRAATRVVQEAHDFAGRLVDDAAGHTILGPSSSALLRMIADAYAEVLESGSEIVIADTGHESNINPWLRLERQGIIVRWWRVDPKSMELRVEDLDRLLNDRTALVLFPHVSNLLGAVVDAAAVTRRAHAVGARVVVDGVAFAPHRLIEARRWEVDWYVVSAYKVYAPHMAVLYGRKDAVAELTGPNHFFIPRESVPYKFELGGVTHEACAGLVALQPYLNFLAGRPESTPGAPGPAPADRDAIEAAFAAMAALETPLTERLVAWLADRTGVRVIGPTAPGADRVPTVSFVHEARTSADIARAVDETGIALRNGHMYAWRLCEALGIDPEDGVVRVSLLHYNTPGEVERLLEVLDAVLP